MHNTFKKSQKILNLIQDHKKVMLSKIIVSRKVRKIEISNLSKKPRVEFNIICIIVFTKSQKNQNFIQDHKKIDK